MKGDSFLHAASQFFWFFPSPQPGMLEARVTPSHGFNMFSAQEELQAGQQSAAQVAKQLPVLPDSDPVTIYVQRLGQQLAAHAPGEKWPYTFHVVNQKEINAFALPGGPVFVNLGTIQAADNEAQLAGVMAHEISHVVQRHGTRAASKQMAAQLPLAILGGVMGQGALSQMAQMGLGVWARLLLSEELADSRVRSRSCWAPISCMTAASIRAPWRISSRRSSRKAARAGRSFSATTLIREIGRKRSRRKLPRFPARPAIARTARNSATSSSVLPAMKPLTAQQIAALRQNPAAMNSASGAQSGGGVTAVSSLRNFSHRDFTISYPENWQLYGDQNSAITIAPQGGVIQNAVAYGFMVNTYQPEDTNASLDQSTHDLLASLRQANPDVRQIGQDENIRINGVAGKSVDLIGTSPLKDQNGRPNQERTGWSQSSAAMASVVCSCDCPGQGLRIIASYV